MKNFFHVFLRMFTKFFGERPSKLAISLCVALFASTTAFAEEYITDVMVIGGDKDRVNFLKDSCGAQGWTVIDKDLNDNAGVGTDYVYLLYKKSSESGGSNGFITDFIIKTDEYPDSYIFNGRTYYRIPHKGSEHFEIHGGNLNSGTVSSSTNMRLYYTKEEFPDRRIVRDIAFTDAKLKSGYTTLGRNGAVVGSDGSGAMDLNEGAGSSSDYIYMHFATVSYSMDTPEYISDVVVLGGSKDEVNALKERYASRGWIVIDQDLNDNAGAGTDYIYMAYKKSHFSDVNKGFITDFIIKTGDHPDSFTFNGRTYYRASNFGDGNFAIYGGNLNSGTVSSSTNMWLYFTRESFPDTCVVSNIAFTSGKANKTKEGYTTLGENGAVVGNDGSGAMDLNEGAGSSSDYIYMHFAIAPKVNITFVTGLENISVPMQTVVSGSTPTKPTDPERTGLKFKGWFADDAFSTEFVFSSPVTSNISVYAKWEASVTFVTGVENVSVPTQTIVFGNTPTKPANLERSGFTFMGWYTSADGNTLFDFSTPVTSNTTVYAKWWNNVRWNVINLRNLTKNSVVQDGDLLTGTLGGNYKISIADGATVMLYGVTINGKNKSTCEWAGLTCEGDCKIILKGENTVKGFDSYYPGIYVPKRKTLTVEGDGSLDASSNGFGAGIGGGYSIGCGNIVINDGTVIATGGNGAAGIGSGEDAIAGDITISGGSVTATGGHTAAGIGGGYSATAGDITISGGSVTATGSAAGIGSGHYSASVGDITISGGSVTATGSAAGIGSGNYAFAGSITISGGTVTATGGSYAAGIGSGYEASAGSITITDGVTLVTANKGERSPNSVGLGKDGKYVGKIIIDDEVTGNISTSSFTFPKKAYTVVFDKNGGDGAMVDQTLYIGYEEPLSRNLFTREKYGFVGWNTDPNGNGVAYDDGAKVQNLTDEAGATVTLYAQWFKTEGNVVNLRNLKKNSVVQDGDLLTGTLGGSYKISIADGATVTLYGVTINGYSNENYKYEWAGITCLGNCTIVLKGKNSVKGFWEDYPGIHVLEGGTLTIEGGENDTLYASSNGWAPGIGGGFEIGCGNINIMGGVVFATGGKNSAGIGLGEVRDGVVTSCGDITIASGVTRVTARGGDGAPYSIGIGTNTGSGQSSVGKIIIDDEVTGNISTSPFTFPKKAYTVVFDKNGGDGAMVDQTLYIGYEDIGYEEPLSRNLFTREKYVFVGWNTDPNGNGVAYDDGAKVQNLTDEAGATVTLYAQWLEVEENVINLRNLTKNSVVQDGDLLTGTLGGNYKISIADGATVTLFGATIIPVGDGAYKWAGITCEGDCKIILKGENTVKGFYEKYPGIYVPEGKTLTVEGDGSLDASSNGFGAGIGGGYGINCGNIVINAGTVTATGGESAAGIGSGEHASAGSITISGGTVTATGGHFAAGIGSGEHASAGSITISGGTVTATGGHFAAGIGSGERAFAGDITITDGVTQVTATKGEFSPNSVGLGKDGNSVGKISIGGVFVDGISESPYTFQTYDVVFNANGGTGSMEKQRFVYNANPTALSKNIFTREGYTFVGWNTRADGEGLAYSNREKVQDLVSVSGAEITLYAQWNKTVQSLAAIVISQDGNGKLHATIDGDYAGTDIVSIDDENGIVVDKVELDRTLSTTGYATITLPFDIDSAKVKGAKQFLKFVGVILNEDTGFREVHFERAWCDLPTLLADIDKLDDLSDKEKKEKKEKVSAKCNAVPKKLFAYTPYVVQMKAETLTFDDGVTLVKTPATVDTVVGNWKFKGTLAPKTWEEGDPEIGNAYGYVAGTGEFKKVGDKSSIGALRSYLVYEKRTKTQSSANVPGMSNIRANFSTETLPANMDVVIVDDDENGKEHRTVIGRFNTRTGEFTPVLPENRTFDVKGRHVNETRSVGKGRKAKGVYYGRKR